MLILGSKFRLGNIINWALNFILDLNGLSWTNGKLPNHVSSHHIGEFLKVNNTQFHEQLLQNNYYSTYIPTSIFHFKIFFQIVILLFV